MESSRIRVSVVIPTHNRCDLLARLLASLEAQTLDAASYEVIIVHNHTPDGTEHMAGEWCARQAFAARYFRKNFQGPARSRDFGARAANGQLLAFIDDDCVATPEWLAAGLAAFDVADTQEGGQPAGLVQGATLPMPGQARTLLSKTIEIPGPTVFFETCNIFYSRAAFARVGGFSEDFLDRFYGEDTDLGWKLIEAGYTSRFTAAALVYHEVFRVSLYRWLAEPLHFRNLPYLVKKYPALRRHMYMRYFISRDSFLFNLLPLAVALLPLLGGYALVLATPYFVERYRNGRHIQKVHLRVLRALAGVLRGAFSWWALAGGSCRAGALLL